MGCGGITARGPGLEAFLVLFVHKKNTLNPMIRAAHIIQAGAWSNAAQSVTLDYDRRFRRRLRFVTDQGTEILLDLPEAVHIRGGDALMLEDGALVEVRAADEALLHITAPTPDALIRLAWHLGNRHLCVQFLPQALR